MIERLKAALEAMNSAHVTCENTHHAKKDRGHAFGDCPVVTRYAVAMSGLDDVIAEMEAGEPIAFCVYFPTEQRHEFCEELDDLIEDITNLPYEVTPLYAQPKAEPAPPKIDDPDAAHPCFS